jgi:hypothetical protein
LGPTIYGRSQHCLAVPT